jgi:hypothetical protein
MSTYWAHTAAEHSERHQLSRGPGWVLLLPGVGAPEPPRPGNGMRGAVPGGFAPVAVEGGEPIILSVRTNGKGQIWFRSEPANGGPGVTIPEATAKKEAAHSSPKPLYKRTRPSAATESLTTKMSKNCSKKSAQPIFEQCLM